MELRLESSALRDGIDATAQFFKTQRMVACCGDRFTLACLCLAEPIRRAVGAATTEEEGFELVLRHKPSLLICTSDLETGYGMNLLRRVKAELPACQLLIVLVRETQAVVQAYADAVIFKSILGTGKGDFVQALQTLSEGGVYLPGEIRKLGAAEAPNPNLPPLIEELTERELEVVAGVARGLTNQGIGSSLGISVETVKTHVVNAKDKLGAADRTQLAVMALLYGLIDPLG
ncbi:MAG: response regulator transcription factor [Cyanobacteria bacterium MAG STY1_bin_7]|nr:response regulator transcription factor [Cyanobacteria bacterium MAG STY1_bin_7]